MPKILVAYVRCIDSMNMWVGKILSGAILVIIGILLIEAVSRYGFNAPTEWSLELSQFVLGAYFFIGGGCVLLLGGHVNMDAFYNRWSPKKRAILDLATFPLLAVYLIVFMFKGIDNVWYSLRYNQHSRTLWEPPLAPIKIIIVVGVVLLLLQGIAFLIRDLATVRGKSIP